MFEHAALFYEDRGEFLAGTAAFIQGGLSSGDAVMVVVDRDKITGLRGALGADAEAVQFMDMREVGVNPARIIPEWRRFVDEHHSRGREVRGIGEPIWPGRTAAELVECEHHEALLNVAFADTRPWRLLCPYDTTGLGPAVVERARETHPYLAESGSLAPSEPFCSTEVGVLDDPLPPPPARRAEVTIDIERLSDLRRFVADQAHEAGLPPSRVEDLVLAVSEIAANSLEHGGGSGALSVWSEDASLICEIQDAGHLSDPLVGRGAPTVRQAGGRGVWVANQVCDLVQIRSSPAGTTVRLHMGPGAAG